VQRCRFLRDVEDDGGLLPFRGLAERPVVHVVDLVRAGRGVDPEPQARPVADLAGPDRRRETDPAAGVAAGRDALHEGSEADGVGDAFAQSQLDYATAVIGARAGQQSRFVIRTMGARDMPRCGHGLKLGEGEQRA
jgi:hypothetical protein